MMITRSESIMTHPSYSKLPMRSQMMQKMKKKSLMVKTRGTMKTSMKAHRSNPLQKITTIPAMIRRERMRFPIKVKKQWPMMLGKRWRKAKKNRIDQTKI